jgi:hypothetical protein
MEVVLAAQIRTGPAADSPAFTLISLVVRETRTLDLGIMTPKHRKNTGFLSPKSHQNPPNPV